MNTRRLLARATALQVRSSLVAADGPAGPRSGPVVATYNIHATVGRDKRADPHRIVRVIRSLDADVVALQEVPLGAVGESGPSEVDATWLERGTGMRSIAGPTLRLARSVRGNALLTRLEIECSRLHDLSRKRREIRGAIEAYLRSSSGRRLRVVATHLGLSAKERLDQVRRLIEIVNDDTTVPTVILGDLNFWWPLSRAAWLARSRFGPAPTPRSYPSSRPLFALDRVFAARGCRIRSVTTLRAGDAAVASDHLPVVAALAPLPRTATGRVEERSRSTRGQPDGQQQDGDDLEPTDVHGQDQDELAEPVQ
jgi:endonuclease/exonuclease/phosphatase family metal-dependent hydrolase